MFISLDRARPGPYQNWWKIVKNHESHNFSRTFRNFCATDQSPEVLDFILVENDHFWGGFQCKRPPNRRVVKKQSHAKLWDVDLKWNAWKWMELQGFKGNKNEWSEHNPYRLNSTQTLEFPLFSMDFTPIGFPEFCIAKFWDVDLKWNAWKWMEL